MVLSFQYRSNKNADCNLNSVFEKGTPRFRKNIKGKVFSLLTGGGGNKITGIGCLMFCLGLKFWESNKSKYWFFFVSKFRWKIPNESLDILGISKKKDYQAKY